MIRVSLTAFADELYKVADLGAVQSMIDKRLAPFKPPAPETRPPLAAPVTPPPAPTMDQAMGQIRAKATAAAREATPTIKTPRTVFGVRG